MFELLPSFFVITLMTQYNLNTSVAYLKGVGPNRADILKTELRIHTFLNLTLSSIKAWVPISIFKSPDSNSS